MKTVQKLELSAGIATLAATIAFIYFIDIPQSKKIAELDNYSSGYPWIQSGLFLILPALLIAICSYFPALKQSRVGFGIILILGGILSFLYTIGFLSGSAFEGHVLIGISPGFFRICHNRFCAYRYH